MTSSLPAEMWVKVFTFLSWKDKLNVRGTCCYFKELMDKSRPLWHGFTVVLRHFPRYNRGFWLSLAQRHVGGASVCSAQRKQLKSLHTWLPQLHALRLVDCREGGVVELKGFKQLQHLSITSCSAPLTNLSFLFPLSAQLTRLSLCHAHLTCPAAHLAAAVSHLRRLTSLLLHHDGSVKIPKVGGVLTHLAQLKHLSWTMINYKTLPPDFFGPAPSAGGALPLSDLHLLDYDATVTQEVLLPLSRLLSLSVFHLYSVPGPVCHLRTWLTSLVQLRHLSVHGGHPLGAYADVLPPALQSLSVCADVTPADLQVASLRLPELRRLRLEPWGSSNQLVRLLPQLFPQLTSLGIRHQQVSDADFLSLQQLRHLRTLEVLDSFHRPVASDPGLVVQGPGPRLLALIQELQERTHHRVRVVTGSRADPLACRCV